MATKAIEEVLAAYNERLLSLPGVVGTAIGVCDGAPCILVFLSHARHVTPDIPARLDGYRVRVQVSGTFRARP